MNIILSYVYNIYIFKAHFQKCMLLCVYLKKWKTAIYPPGFWVHCVEMLYFKVKNELSGQLGNAKIKIPNMGKLHVF